MMPRRSHAARAVYVDPRDYEEACKYGLHKDGDTPIPLLLSVSTDRWGSDVKMHVFSLQCDISVMLPQGCVRFVNRDE